MGKSGSSRFLVGRADAAERADTDDRGRMVLVNYENESVRESIRCVGDLELITLAMERRGQERGSAEQQDQPNEAHGGVRVSRLGLQVCSVAIQVRNIGYGP